jgi:chromosome segregation ATPase
MNYYCNRCQDRTVVGGFLPAPCPQCQRDSADCEYCGARDNYREREALTAKLARVEAERDKWQEAVNELANGAAKADDRAHQAGLDRVTAELQRDATIRQLHSALADLAACRERLAGAAPHINRQELAISDMSRRLGTIERDTAEAIARHIDALAAANPDDWSITGDDIRTGAWRPR